MKRLSILSIILASLLSQVAYASCELKADTSGELLVGPFYDATDGVTAETGLTVEDGDILWQQPGSTTIAEEAGFSDCTHRAGGYYTCPYDATVVDTEGTAGYVVNESGAVPVFEKCLVLGADFYDAKYGVTGLLTCDHIGAFGGCAQTVTIDALTDQDTFSLSAGPDNDDAWNNFEICVVDGSSLSCGQITDYTASGNDVQLAAALEFTVGTSDTVYVYKPGTATVSGGVTIQGTITTLDALDTAQDSQHATTQSAISTAQNDLDALSDLILLSSACDSGTTSTCVDATLTQSDDAFNYGVEIVFPSIDTSACVYDFTASSDTLTFWTIGTDIDTESYYLVANPICASATDESP